MFRNSILAGEELVRSGMRSPDYSAGSAGWRVGRDGSAEFNDVRVRGILVAGDPDDAHIQIGDVDQFLAPTFRLWPRDPTLTTVPGSIESGGGGPSMVIQSPLDTVGDAQAEISLVGERPGLGQPATAVMRAELVWLEDLAQQVVVQLIDSTGLLVTAPNINLDTAGVLDVLSQIRRNGRRLAGGSRGGVHIGNTDLAGDVSIPHGLGYTPTFVAVSWEHTGTLAVDQVAVPKVVARGPTTIQVRVWNSATGAVLAVNPARVAWYAGESW